MGRPENVLQMSQTINLPGTSLERQIRTCSGCNFRPSPGRHRDGPIGSLGDLLGKLEWDVLETSRGSIFAK